MPTSLHKKWISCEKGATGTQRVLQTLAPFLGSVGLVAWTRTVMHSCGSLSFGGGYRGMFLKCLEEIYSNENWKLSNILYGTGYIIYKCLRARCTKIAALLLEEKWNFHEKPWKSFHLRKEQQEFEVIVSSSNREGTSSPSTNESLDFLPKTSSKRGRRADRTPP